MSYGDYLRVSEAERWFLPHEPASVPGYVKHVYCEGSRDHVLSYEGWPDWMGDTFAVTRCSVKNCIVNHEAERTIAEHQTPGYRRPKNAQEICDRALADLRESLAKIFRDSDQSGEAGETRRGSTEGESAGPQDIAETAPAHQETNSEKG